MSLTNIFFYFGLRRPYDFSRAIPFLLSCIGLIIVFSLITYYVFTGTLSPSANRAVFLYYLLALFLTSVILLRFKLLSWALFSIAAVELFLALGTHVGSKIGLPLPSLMPSNESFWASSSRFKYHPILMGIPRENFISESGLDIRHNSKNLRGSEIAVGASQRLINAYGGSSTYDIGVPNGNTWPEILDAELGEEWVVANFGVPGYSSVEHVIQTAFYSDSIGVLPSCSLYYMGWNDIRNAHIPDLDAAYADFHLLSQLGNLQVRGSSSGFSPFYRLVTSALRHSFDTVPYPPSYRALGPVEGNDARLEKIFEKNMQTIYALNGARGVKTVFIGQILNPTRLTSDSLYGWFPRVRDKDVWPLQERFNVILRREAERLGASTVILDVEKFVDADFVDRGHFSVSGSKKFAKLIVAEVKRSCQQ